MKRAELELRPGCQERRPPRPIPLFSELIVPSVASASGAVVACGSLMAPGGGGIHAAVLATRKQQLVLALAARLRALLTAALLPVLAPAVEVLVEPLFALTAVIRIVLIERLHLPVAPAAIMVVRMAAEALSAFAPLVRSAEAASRASAAIVALVVAEP